ncbi:helix-turn-helix transcriptional regulator [Herbiconiux sp. 11R-BC]|uniref:helix-turn-helix transcriptional regulator n=1 Tax=Herbiconiux sp. 11R-BC TaxID=3111637 RepID=UPI003C065B31
MSSVRSTTPLGEFLRARREILQPEQAGIPRLPGRRVPGLRREEVAELAGMSPDYYLRIEQGRDKRPSEQVLLALSRALQLDADGRQYLLRLGRARPYVRNVADGRPTVGPGVRMLLEQWSTTPTYVTDRNQNVLAVNSLIVPFAPSLSVPGTNLLTGSFNTWEEIRSGLTDSDETGRIAAAWETALREMTESLRYYGDPEDPELQELVGSLSARHALFRTIWAEYNPKPQMSGVKKVHIDPLGWIDFRWQTLEVPRSGGQFLTTFFGEAGSPAAAAIAYLAARASGPAVRVVPSADQASGAPDTAALSAASAVREA